MNRRYKGRIPINPPTKRDARENALYFERQVKQARSLFRYPLKTTEYEKKVFPLFESAGDEWIKQAAKRVNPRDVKNSLLSALDNYKLAEKIVKNEQEKDRMQKKIDSLTSKIDDLRPLKGLNKKLTFAGLSILSFLVALFFISFNLTGNVIKGISQNNSNLISVCLFVLGIVLSFFYFKNKK